MPEGADQFARWRPPRLPKLAKADNSKSPQNPEISPPQGTTISATTPRSKKTAVDVKELREISGRRRSARQGIDVGNDEAIG
jgi:hypothetical protein